MIRIHHLDCGTLCTLAPRALVGSDEGLVCHVLLVETDEGLVLVDTGLGTADCATPRERLGRGFLFLARPRLDPERTAIARVRALGFRPEDVRHVVLTHLDLDHAGGLSDFPWAKVHCTLQEHEAAMLASTRVERQRYRSAQWAHWPDFELYRTRGTQWFGIDAVELRGLPPDIRLLPLFGHTRGHAGVAVRGPDGWVLHAGDAYYHHGTIGGGRVPLGLRIMQRVVDMDTTARRASRDRVRSLAAAGEVTVFCAHDPTELARFSGSPT